MLDTSLPAKKEKKQFATVSGKVFAGTPLAVRVTEALLSERYAFCHEFTETTVRGPVDVFGVYKDGNVDAADYAIEVVGQTILSCSCTDFRTRYRVCKHMVLLMLLCGYGIEPPDSPRIAPATEFFAPTAPIRAEYIFTEVVKPRRETPPPPQMPPPPPADYFDDWNGSNGGRR